MIVTTRITGHDVYLNLFYLSTRKFTIEINISIEIGAEEGTKIVSRVYTQYSLPMGALHGNIYIDVY